MSLLEPGYWPTSYWPSRYWPINYWFWAKYALVVFTGRSVQDFTGRSLQDFTGRSLSDDNDEWRDEWIEAV